MRRICSRCFSLLLSAVLLLSFAPRTLSEDVFTLKRIGNLIPFAKNEFVVHAPEKGCLTITVRDETCVYRILSQEIEEGDSHIIWDGCGFNKEKLSSKTYTIHAELVTEKGKNYSTSFISPVEYSGQNLQYALPSSGKMALNGIKDWFLEFRTVAKGTVVIELVSSNDADTRFLYKMNTAGGRINRKNFSEIAGNEQPATGRYRLFIYEASIPEEKFEYDLEITDCMAEKKDVFVTGEILPDRGMSDSQVWDLMMKPSVVVDIDYFSHQQIFEKQDTGSRSMGTVHGQTQALKIIKIDRDWAFVGAWNHEEAEYVEGWVPLELLKVVEPQTDYGLLIDKKDQTMSVYYKGTKIDTLLVSTGRAERNKYEQETTAGSFLTGFHRVDFSMNGKKYDYVIQYDGGNLLHQTPYAWGLHKKDFSLGRGYLGTKASHACVRIQSEPADGGVNAYWLWTHIPFHTRVIILDDAEERRDYISKLKRSSDFEQSGGVSILNPADADEPFPEDSVILSFAGTMIPGGTPAYNQRADSFVSAYRKQGKISPFAQLLPWFENDDLTCVIMRGLLKEPPEEYLPGTEQNQAPPETAEVFGNSSVEMVVLCESTSPNHSAERDTDETAGSILPYSRVLKNESEICVQLKGHLFGFTSCSESEYLKDPKVIDRRIRQLKEENCERIIVLCNWGDGKTTTHSLIQEAMAHRCARAGADLIIGNQPHSVQGTDRIGSVPVIYSTGMLMDGSNVQAGREKGVVVRAVFSFGGTEGNNPAIRIIPINPYGASKGQKNRYSPELFPSMEAAEKTLETIWNDSTDASLGQTAFLTMSRKDQ